MDVHQIIAIATLVCAVYLFISERIPLAMTALAIPIVLAATGTLERPDQALIGFGNSAVIALAAIFVLGAGLKESGVATLMARGLQRVGGHSEMRLVVAIMVAVACLSAFMSNAATVAVFLPAVAVLARKAEVPNGRLMMPLAYAAIVGGTITVIGTTPNLILAEDMRQRTGEALDMLVFAEVGVPVTALCIAYMALLGRRGLPTESAGDKMRAAQAPEDLARAYGLKANMYRMKLVADSAIVGQTLRDAGIGHRYQLKVLLIQRPRGTRMRTIHPDPDVVFTAGDELYMEGEEGAAWEFAEEAGVQFGLAGPRSLERVLGHGVTLAEVTLPPRSDALGKTFRELDFRKHHRLSVLSLYRNGQVHMQTLADMPLSLGDGFLVSGSADAVRAFSHDPRFIVMTQDLEGEDVRRAPVALVLLLVALLPPLLGWLPLALSAMAAALLMVATRCVSVASIKDATDFRILFLIAGTIPLGLALEQRGVAQEMASGVLALEGSLGAPGVIAVLFLVSAVLSTTSNNGAAAVILAPVAWEVTQGSGIPLEKTFMAVAFGTSCAFLLPFAHQCNLLVMGPGGYVTRDFARVGLGMSIVMAIGTVVLLTVL